ncbi:MAG: flavin reductase family protein [Chloroflexi bacterium]|nr:flavin reductase family protein [Chloroflexota bacterium]MCI0648413.1 flavin reductase family protein [Chloroflexota bacterium]MCI0727649.1 flavin reductase family protein [Chloroflexota bacterium]
MSSDPIKDALKLMRYGFYSITSCSGDDVNAMVANWVIQASFEPRLIVMGLQKTSYSHGLIERGGVFTVNLFRAADQEAIRPFTKGRAKNPDKMANAQYTPAPETGCPILAGAAAYIECRVAQMIDVGSDHDLLVGEVVGAGVLKEDVETTDMLLLTDLGWSYAG